MFKRIMVPVDPSNTAKQAFTKAFELANELKATLCILHHCRHEHISNDFSTFFMSCLIKMHAIYFRWHYVGVTLPQPHMPLQCCSAVSTN